MAARLNILFPVETAARELDFRLFLAALHAGPRNRIFIGKHHALVRATDRLAGGVFLGKSFIEPHNTSDLATRNRLKRRGFRCVHLDTEGAVYLGGEAEWRRVLNARLNPTLLDVDDSVCTWGDFQRDHYRSLNPPCAENIHTTGAPEFDLYKPSYRSYYDADVSGLRDRFGDFILINSSFARANHHAGESFVFSRHCGYDPTDPNKRINHADVWASKTISFARFVTLIHRLSAAHPNTQVIVRPHPSDNRTRWQAVLAGICNVHVLHEGPVAPWILACRVMLHDGCTTSIEAHIAGASAINYTLGDRPEEQKYLAGVFGTRCTTQEEVMDTVRRALEHELPRTTQIPELARRLLANLEHDAFAQMRTVPTHVEEHVQPMSGRIGPVALQEKVHDVAELTKAVLRPLSDKRVTMASYSYNKFPGFDTAAIGTKLARIERITGRRVRHEVLGRELLVVSAAG